MRASLRYAVQVQVASGCASSLPSVRHRPIDATETGDGIEVRVAAQYRQPVLQGKRGNPGVMCRNRTPRFL
jgi:hypothetical protein